MLIRLEPDQISRYWDTIREGVRGGLPPTAANDDDRMANVLAALLSGRAQAWIIMQDKQVVGIVITMILVEEMTDTKNLIIYSFAGFSPILRTSWMKSMQELVKFAQGMGCRSVGAFTTHKGIVDMLKKRVPGTKEETYVTIPVNQAVNE